MADIDRLMIELSGDDAEAPQPASAPTYRTKPVGFVILAAVTTLSWLPWVAPLSIILQRSAQR